MKDGSIAIPNQTTPKGIKQPMGNDDNTTGENSADRIIRLLELLDKETREDFNAFADRALWHALTRWKDRLPKLDEYFHKCFRQCNVTDDGHTDMVIWNLLNHSKRFWRLFEMVQDEPNTSVSGPCPQK